MRPLAPDDDLSFLDITPELPREAALARLTQRRLLAAHLPVCWVAVDRAGKVAYMQWLIAAADNRRIQTQWGNVFPPLGPDEALLEGAYTPEAYRRGQGIMPYAMAKIAEQACGLGARWVNIFVDEHNIPALKGCRNAGFFPYWERRQVWSFFRRRMVFTPLPQGTRYSFES